MQVEDFVDLMSESADANEPLYKLVCPLDDVIVSRKKLSKDNNDYYRKYFRSIVKISWKRDGKEFRRRENGNRFDIINGDLILYQIGSSDEGSYTCQVDYSNVPNNLWNQFRFHRGANLEITVPDPLPDTLASITHPPADIYAHRGANVTLTCKCVVTLSTPRITWFKSCPFRDNATECMDKFMNAYDKAERQASTDALKGYIFNNNNVESITITNVSEKNIGHYACASQNNKGIDLRLGRVDLVDNLQPPIVAPVRQQPTSNAHAAEWIWLSIGFASFLLMAMLIAVCIYVFKLSMKRDKKQCSPLIPASVGTISSTKKTSGSRQRLPTIEAPDIYNTGKSIDGFISGHFCQEAGHLMAQSICSNLLNKVNPSISSSNSHQSDEASSSWGKSMSSGGGDNSRTFYSHASNATATTVPLYDHPPSTRTVNNSNIKTFVHSSCVSNPSYWLLNPNNDTAEWNFPRRNLERMDKIGEGQFGEVWRYIARQKDGSGTIVAVKRLKDDLCASVGERSELRAEIEIMKAVNNHPNVIKLLHCCIDDCGPILLIMEYAEHGKLQTYLRGCRSPRRPYECISDQPYNRPSITSKELIKFTYHIAKGMEYVASLGIVHRDLASRNILVSKDRICKVADFGFARRVDEECVYVRKSTNPVPVKWMAPEALEGNKFTYKSDVFSLGILMWEIVTLGATPYEQMTSEGVYKKVTTGGRLERPTHCRDEFFTLMDQCWMHDAALRPTFKEVAEQLEKLLLSENDYIELDQYPEHAYYNIVNGAEKEVVQLST